MIFEYTHSIFERHVLLLVCEYQNKVELTLKCSEGECGSGWCSAYFAEHTWKEVTTFAEKNYTPIKDIFIELDKDSLENLYEDEFSCEVFSYSPIGGDCYYPCGDYEVSMDMFKPVGIFCHKRPVHIFHGESNLCKSHIASLTNKDTFETDSVDTLPENITSDIVVLGNRNRDWTVEDIKNRIAFPDQSKIVVVHFSEV